MADTNANIKETSPKSQFYVSSPSYFETKESRGSSLEISDDGLPNDIKILEIAHVLQNKAMFLNGGTDKEGHPLILCLESQIMSTLNEHDFTKAAIYLKDLGNFLFDRGKFVIVIDRLNDKWSAVKLILKRLNAFAVDEVHQVIVIKPSGFFQKHFGSGDSNKIQSTCKHHVVYLESVSLLTEYIEQTNLPKEFEGVQPFDVNEWIEHTTAIERFQSTCAKSKSQFQRLKTSFHEKTPQTSISDIDKLHSVHKQQVEDVTEDLRSSLQICDTLKSIINKPVEVVLHNQSLLTKYNAAQLKARGERLEELSVELGTLWDAQQSYYDQAREVVNFEQRYGEISIRLLEITSLLESRTDVGDSLGSAKVLMQELDTFESQRKVPYTEMMELKDKGLKMLALFEHFAMDSLNLRVIEIKKLCEDFEVKLEARRDLLQTSLDVYVCLDQLHTWCQKGTDMLASQPVDVTTVERAKKCLQEIEDFIKNNAKGINMKKMNQITSLCKKLENPEVDESVNEALARIEKVKEMFAKREASLSQMITKPDKPVQPVKPINVKQQPDELDGPPVQSLQNAMASQFKKNDINVIIQEDVEKMMRNKTFRKSLRMTRKKNTPSVLFAAEQEEDPEHRKKIRHVITELINTEDDYVRDLQTILEGYHKPFDNPKYNFSSNLRAQKNIIFGNIEEIYKFHHDVFSRELRGCETAPYLAGQIFLDKKEEFQLYATYCKNKPRSEMVQKELENSTYLKECQQSLGHLLPLSSYLLKPVQRVTKYRLLLSEMLKYVTKDNPAYADIIEALHTMNKVLRNVNDVMHSSGLIGFPGDLDDQGKLMLQDALCVWEVKKNTISTIKPINKLRGKNRQVFLFEKVLIIAKKDVIAGKDTGTYHYSRHVKTEGLGMTEQVKGDPRKFEFWLPGRTEVFVFQAIDAEAKDTWILEMRKLLFSQLQRSKENATPKVNVQEKRLSKEELQQRLSFMDTKESSTPSVQEEEEAELSRDDEEIEDFRIRQRRKFSFGKATRIATLKVKYENQDISRSSSDNSLFIPQSNSNTDLHNNLLSPAPLSEAESNYESDDPWSDSEFDDEYGNDEELDEGSLTSYGQTEDSATGSLISPLSNDVPAVNYVAIVDFTAVESTELSFKDGDFLSFIKAGDEGWWYCKHESTSLEGWVPSGFLELRSQEFEYTDAGHSGKAVFNNTTKVRAGKFETAV